MMFKPKKCIIDNWSLEHAAFLLDGSDDLSQRPVESLMRNFGGLSNFINALLLYQDSFFIVNGFEKDWKRFKWFDTNVSAFINGVQLDELVINWTSSASYEDKGIGNYLLTSRYFESDLLVCPERSEEITTTHVGNNSAFIETLREIDRKILQEKDTSTLTNIKIGIERNFQVPSMTQYVLSEASSRDDLLTVIMQLRSDGKIGRVIKEIEEITSTTQGAGRFERDVQNLVKKAFGRRTDEDNSFSVSVAALFFQISKTINLDYFRRKEHLVFLKRLIACRSEVSQIESDILRIFNTPLNR